jgi:prepilin-type N-terminal cleavage/methylation domain-containing protein
MRKSNGFTLIELLVVITIIGLLTVALLPQINKVMGQGDSAATQARIELLRAMIEKYNNREGEYPPSDFAKALKGVKVKADPTNMGIECLLIHLHQKSLGANFSLEDKPDWLKNTDADDNGAEIPTLRTTKKLEVVDAWHNPLVYFRADSYRKPQEVMFGDEEGAGAGSIAAVSAMKDDRGYLASQKYQLISAGEDGEFGTDDDVCYPKVIPK